MQPKNKKANQVYQDLETRFINSRQEENEKATHRVWKDTQNTYIKQKKLVSGMFKWIVQIHKTYNPIGKKIAKNVDMHFIKMIAKQKQVKSIYTVGK